MKNINEIHISLKLFEFSCSPFEISNKLGIVATREGLKGELVPGKGNASRTWPYNFWEYGNKLETNEFIEMPVNNYIEDIIKPRVVELTNIISSCKAELSVAQYYYAGHNPGFHLEPQALNILCSIGVGIDFDIYCLAED